MKHVKSSLLGIVLFCGYMVGQPIVAQNGSNELPTPTVTAAPSKWLSWFKSLRMPNKEDVRRAQAYVNSRWRCLRYGENCSKGERVILGLLTIATITVVAKLFHSGVTRAMQKHSKKKQQELLSAADEGRVDDIKKLLETSAIDINYMNHQELGIFSGFTPLMLAVKGHHSDVVKELLKHPDVWVSKPLVGTNPPMTALMLAVDNNDANIVAELVKHPRIWPSDIENAYQRALTQGLTSIQAILKPDNK